MAETIEIAVTLNRRLTRLRVGSDRRLIDVLRDDLRLTGAKEGCGQGECGSCTVLLNGRPAASCLTMAFQVDGLIVETVEGLHRDGPLHPLQRALLASGAVQCGACIPGMLLSAKAILDENPGATRDEVRRGLAGNLCRCTGYVKVVDAVLEAARTATGSTSWRDQAAPSPIAPTYCRPRSLEEALEILDQRQGLTRPVAGGTDLLAGGSRTAAELFDLSSVREMQGIQERGDALWIGATTTHLDLAASALVRRYAPALAAACADIGGPQVQSRGTLGGSLAAASADADPMAPLLVADAVVELVSITARRGVPVARFVTGPRATVLSPDELIVGVTVPKQADLRGAYRRLATRRAVSRSKVAVAVAITFRDARPHWVRIAVAGASPTAIRVPEAEHALLNHGIDSGLPAAKEAMRTAVRPVEDERSTGSYRRAMAAVLLERALREAVPS